MFFTIRKAVFRSNREIVVWQGKLRNVRVSLEKLHLIGWWLFPEVLIVGSWPCIVLARFCYQNRVSSSLGSDPSETFKHAEFHANNGKLTMLPFLVACHHCCPAPVDWGAFLDANCVGGKICQTFQRFQPVKSTPIGREGLQLV